MNEKKWFPGKFIIKVFGGEVRCSSIESVKEHEILLDLDLFGGALGELLAMMRRGEQKYPRLIVGSVTFDKLVFRHSEKWGYPIHWVGTETYFTEEAKMETRQLLEKLERKGMVESRGIDMWKITLAGSMCAYPPAQIRDCIVKRLASKKVSYEEIIKAYQECWRKFEQELLK